MEYLKAEVIKSIFKTAQQIDNHIDYPMCAGVYAFILKEGSSLTNFAIENEVLYIGIAKDSLKKRDLGNHFNSKSTGSSTLRRSLGAVLKNDFCLIAFSRNGTDSKIEITNYIFDEKGEYKLSNWMKENLLIGYWKDDESIPYKDLRELERLLAMELKPRLDLDNRTKKYNPLAAQLDFLRGICRNEAKKNIGKIY